MYYHESPESEEYEPPPLTEMQRAISEERQRQIESLLVSLKPQDAQRALFTFAERKRWCIKRHRKPLPPT